uniref:Transmembrane protein n=1 Tax=Polynucleobacter necessarius subsp. necessarius (strain STIR1) TaxID=452638 RepID=B1XTG7_POLNS
MSISKPSSLLSSSINSISGAVSNLNNELLEYVNPEKPTHDHASVYYKRFFISKFNLGDKAVETKFSSPMQIADGDQITVAGYEKSGSLQVLAYNNQTQQLSSHENWIILGLGALFFFAVAIGLLNSELVAQGTLIPKLFLFGFSIVSIYMGYRALLIREAVKLLSIYLAVVDGV